MGPRQQASAARLGHPAAGRHRPADPAGAGCGGRGRRANITAQEAQLRVLNQQKAYQSVVAPFDGVITQRNIDVGSLVQADAASGTFCSRWCTAT